MCHRGPVPGSGCGSPKPPPMLGLKRQGAAKGFTPQSVAVEDYRVLELGHGARRGLTHGVLDLTGEIEVTHPDVFLSAIASGFGRAKAWGCGLMLIRRVL